MSFKYIQILDNFQIEKLCIYPNYSMDIRNSNIEIIIDDIKTELYSAYTHYNLKSHSVIILLDFTKINNKNTNNIDLISLSKLVDVLQDYFTDMLYKFIIYNYSKPVMYLINILKTFLDPDTRKKIIISQEFKPYINRLINNNVNNQDIKLISDYNLSSRFIVNNNESHC